MLGLLLPSALVLAGPPPEAGLVPDPGAPPTLPTATTNAPVMRPAVPPQTVPMGDPAPAVAQPQAAPQPVATPRPQPAQTPTLRDPEAVGAPPVVPPLVSDWDAPAAELPPPPTDVYQEQIELEYPEPSGSGRGLTIAGLVVGGAGILGKIVVSATAYPKLDPTDFEFSSNHLSSWGVPPGVVIGTGIGLLAGGRELAGRYAAHLHHTEGKEPKPLREALGWALFGTGIGLWGLTRIPYLLVDVCNDVCATALMDGGYYASLPMTTLGAWWGPYATAYKKRKKGLENFGKTYVLVPDMGRDRAGLALVGRF